LPKTILPVIFYVKRVAIPEKAVLLAHLRQNGHFWPYCGQFWQYYGQIWPNMGLITIFGEDVIPQANFM